jgi:hypothetical protein
MESTRLARFKRCTQIAPMQITDRDREIVRLVHRYRFLRSSDIVSLIGGSPQQLLRRLQLLYHHGLLERPRAQLEYYTSGGSHCIVYGIGEKGGALLRRECGIAVQPINWGEKNRAVGRIFLEHALLVSEIMVLIEIGCRRSGAQIRFLSDEELLHENQTTPARERFYWQVNVSRSLKLSVIPDRVFGLEFIDVAGKRDRAFFFLEADRGTMPVTRRKLSHTSFSRKLMAYEATWSQAIHRKRFGFHRFRVLTITTNADRLRSLVNACSQLKRGHGLFLFIDRTAFHNTEDVFSLLWHTGRPDERATLLN